MLKIGTETVCTSFHDSGTNQQGDIAFVDIVLHKLKIDTLSLIEMGLLYVTIQLYENGKMSYNETI